jgi:hypothetical protein
MFVGTIPSAQSTRRWATARPACTLSQRAQRTWDRIERFLIRSCVTAAAFLASLLVAAVAMPDRINGTLASHMGSMPKRGR